ncbi:Cryptochrome DASH, chloroplastic/mitochondrial [Glycine soja]
MLANGIQNLQLVETKCTIRSCIKLPASLGPPPTVQDWGCLPSLEQLGLSSQSVNKGMKFVGGETAALSRVYEYFWKKDLLRVYKETRNGMLGPDYSTKFSPWLASGSLSPRFIYEEVKRYENDRLANSSTYWVLFELIWRDYFRFLSVKYGNSLFHLGGPRKVQRNWSQDKNLFESWRDGCTGYPLIDANMKELSTTGFMSNRGRQIVCSFLVRDMGIDWRMGAEWFETCLLDYDPCSNYGNWTYGSGVGNDPREDRYFSIPKQAQTYDPEGEYVAYWLPQLRKIPKEKRNFPGNLIYIPQIVPLKFGTTSGHNKDKFFGARRTNDRGNCNLPSYSVFTSFVCGKWEKITPQFRSPIALSFSPNPIASHTHLQDLIVPENQGMADDDKAVGEGEKKETTGGTSPSGSGKKKSKGFLLRIWNGIFRFHGDDFEKRLQYISKEEAQVMTRMNRRSRSWRRISRHLIVFSVIFEVVAIVYAIMTTRSIDMNWKMRAIRVLPMFLLPALAAAAYTTFVSFTRMCDCRDQKILERLRAERQEKIDELKERTNYYTTQQLIQRYDPDPAAKAAAASVLASKLGADSGLKVYLGDESSPGASMGRSNDIEIVQSSGLRNRRQVQSRSTSPGTTTPNFADQQLVGPGGIDQTQTFELNQPVVVEHHQPRSSTTQDGGWIARIAALLVGEDPTQSYALICGNCYMHNGLARKEDFPVITYYCPHCHALNKPKQSDEHISGLTSPNTGGTPKTDDGVADAVKNARASPAESVITSSSPGSASSSEIEEVSERASVEEKVD